MSTVIRCAVGRFRCPPEPPTPIRFDHRPVEDYFARGSARAAGGSPDIDLRMDYRTLDKVIAAGDPGESTSPYWLHTALRKLIGGPGGGVPVNTVGLLMSGTYKPNPGMLGLMFASRFTSGGDSFAKPERIGAAIFLDAIAEARANVAEYQREIGFTTIHELGHLFNLWHEAAPPVHFMAHSPSNTAFRPPIAFLPRHQEWLSNCSHSRYVLPGGSDFGDYGDLFTGKAALPANRPGRKAKFQLQIRLSQDEFLPCEPVELDLRLKAIGAPRRIPNEIDPGYERCVIWITEPDGECRRYRPTLHYCHGGPSRMLKPGAPFERDLPIFGQAGGYTFRMAGVHRLGLTLELPGAGTLRSNEVEFMVRPWIAQGKKGFERQTLLTSPPVASILYHRATGRRDPGLRRLMDFCRDTPRDHAAGSAGYVLGRMWLERGTKAGQAPDRRKHAQLAQDWLRRALKHGLTGVREQRAHRYLDELAADG